MPDVDINHDTLTRFEAIEARIDALEKATGVEPSSEEQQVEGEIESDAPLEGGY